MVFKVMKVIKVQKAILVNLVYVDQSESVAYLVKTVEKEVKARLVSRALRATRELMDRRESVESQENHGKLVRQEIVKCYRVCWKLSWAKRLVRH